MPKPLMTLSVAAPGFYGLNKQQSGGILPPGWATEALNCVIDETGRITSCKGYQYTNTSAISGSPIVRSMHEYIDGVGNSAVILSAGNKIYRINGTSYTEVTGTITTPTADNWQFHNFNGNCVGFQASHAPIVATSTSGNFANITLSGTQQPTTAVNAFCAAFGRLWALDGTDLKYSDLLDHTAWNGVFDLSKFWKSGMDEGIAVSEFNGYLAVFGKNNTIVFANPYDPASTMQIVENIGGIGCIARDTVQDVGTDLLFLSNAGVRSLGRTIQEKSMPINDVTKNVRDYMMGYVADETKANIKSVYSPLDGFYLLSLPTSGKTFCIDIRGRLQDGSLRVTEWDMSPTAITRDRTSTIYFGHTGYTSTHTGYLRAIASDGSGGSTYTYIWESGWNDFGQEVANLLKIPKKLRLLMGGVAGRTVTAKWAFDFLDVFKVENVTFPLGTVARYGVAKYTLDVYSGLLTFNSAKSNVSGTGHTIKFGVETNVNGERVVLQLLDLAAKSGRLSI